MLNTRVRLLRAVTGFMITGPKKCLSSEGMSRDVV